jgi:hypothetical protein
MTIAFALLIALSLSFDIRRRSDLLSQTMERDKIGVMNAHSSSATKKQILYFPRLAIACVKGLTPMAEKMHVILALESWLSV